MKKKKFKVTEKFPIQVTYDRVLVKEIENMGDKEEDLKQTSSGLYIINESKKRETSQYRKCYVVSSGEHETNKFEVGDIVYIIKDSVTPFPLFGEGVYMLTCVNIVAFEVED